MGSEMCIRDRCLFDGDEVFSTNHSRGERFCLGADLGPLDAPLGGVSMVGIAEAVNEFLIEPVALGLVTAGFHDPVGDVESVARIAEPGCFVQECLPINPADVPRLADCCLEMGCGDGDLLGGVFDRIIVRGGARLSEDDSEQADGQLHGENPENECVPFQERNW